MGIQMKKLGYDSPELNPEGEPRTDEHKTSQFEKDLSYTISPEGLQNKSQAIVEKIFSVRGLVARLDKYVDFMKQQESTSKIEARKKAKERLRGILDQQERYRKMSGEFYKQWPDEHTDINSTDPQLLRNQSEHLDIFFASIEEYIADVQALLTELRGWFPEVEGYGGE